MDTIQALWTRNHNFTLSWRRKRFWCIVSEERSDSNSARMFRISEPLFVSVMWTFIFKCDLNLYLSMWCEPLFSSVIWTFICQCDVNLYFQVLSEPLFLSVILSFRPLFNCVETWFSVRTPMDYFLGDQVGHFSGYQVVLISQVIRLDIFQVIRLCLFLRLSGCAYFSDYQVDLKLNRMKLCRN
jgi:hypothetical protein